MSLVDEVQPFVIHLGMNDAQLARLQEGARSLGMSGFVLELGGIPDRSALVNYLAETFMFPHEVRGLDAAIDLISDLEWFGNSNGYLVIVRGLINISAVGEYFVSMLPNIIDRWRSQGVPFLVAIDGRNDGLLHALHTANQEMERAGNLPWAQPGTGPAEVLDHG